MMLVLTYVDYLEQRIVMIDLSKWCKVYGCRALITYTTPTIRTRSEFVIQEVE